jgi:uncharacterized protein
MRVTDRVYLDTSALIKRYLPEHNSDSFDAYFSELTEPAISRLTYVEARSTLARKRREGRLSPEQELAAMRELNTDIQYGTNFVRPMAESDFLDAYHLIDDLPDLPLRTLDALHLCIARNLVVTELATADAVMRRVAERLGLKIAYFGTPI